MLQYHFNWKTLSAMAGVTWWNFYFRLFPGTIRSPQVIEFLAHLPLCLGVAPPGYALLETTGRKTAKARRTPVGDGWIGYQFWLVAEHGMKAGYVRNIAANPHVRLKLRHGILARWHTGTAQVLPTMMRGSVSCGLLVGGLAPP